MKLSRDFLILLAAGGSAGLLAAAFLFQALGWSPCALCLWQRWPHAVAVAVGLTALVVGWRSAPILILGALAALATAGIAAYHTGVKRDWWEGPASCTGGGASLGGIEGSSLLPGAVTEVSIPMCDTLEPFLFGLTMANWNLLASVGLALVWLYGLTRPVA